MRRLVPALATALALAGAQGAAGGVPAKNLGCGAGTSVLNVTYHVENDVDTGLKGNNWAFDDYTRALRVVRKSGNRFCAGSTYLGTFTSIAGASPAGKSTIPAGIRGTFRGSSVTTFRATFAPGTQSTRGDLGTKDFQCTSDDRKGRCAGTWDWLSAYFTSTNDFASFKYTRYSFTYHANEGGKGTWSDTLSGGKVRTHGDITAKKPHKQH
jgi:hypothetical protein